MQNKSTLISNKACFSSCYQAPGLPQRPEHTDGFKAKKQR